MCSPCFLSPAYTILYLALQPAFLQCFSRFLFWKCKLWLPSNDSAARAVSVSSAAGTLSLSSKGRTLLQWFMQFILFGLSKDAVIRNKSSLGPNFLIWLMNINHNPIMWIGIPIAEEWPWHRKVWSLSRSNTPSSKSRPEILCSHLS